jgi:hypothetical protein
MTLNTNSTASCTNPVNKTGIVRAMSANAIVVEDTDNPSGGFTQADYEEILASFESIIAPSNLAAFGSHTDIDSNDRIIIFYTVEVNRLTPPNASSFVGGFFHSRDLFPRSGEVVTPSGKQLSACAGSNAAEMFYMLAPDPAGTINNNMRSTAFVKRTTAGTIAHEYQHLINASRRLYIVPAAVFPEAVWLDEGLAHIAEELAFYRATPFEPLMNLTLPMVQQTLDPLNTYQAANLSRLSAYLRNPHAHSPYGETPPPGPPNPSPPDWDDLETRGAIWSFLRWAADREFLSESQVWNRLVRDATAAGADNLRSVFGTDLGARFREWAAATYVDDAPGLSGSITDKGECGSGIALALNELCLTSGSAAGSLSVGTSSEAREYAVIAHFDGGFSRTPTGVSATATGAVPVTGPPSPTTVPLYQASVIALREPVRDFAFERVLRQRERAELMRLVTDNRPSALRSVTPTEPRFNVAPASAFRHPSWNFRSILPAVSGNNNAFPLHVFHLSQSLTTVTLVDGGAAYMRFGVSANGSATLSLTAAGGGQLPPGASAWVVRTK